MTDQLLSPHWYRIADIKLSLARHVRMQQHRYRGTVWYILRDEITGNHNRFNQASYNFIRQLDGRQTVNQIWNALNEELGDDAPTQDEVINLLGSLHFSNYLQVDLSADIQQLIDRRKKERRKLFKSRFGNPLALRFPLVDPDAFLTRYMGYVSPLFTRTAGIISIGIILFAIMQLSKNWELLSNHATENALAPFNIFLMWIVYPVIKVIHELGHGLAVKKWGGQVHELGIMLLVLMPVPYVDASAASSFRSKYKRMIVGAAGIVVELVLASVALLIWLNIQQGLLSDILFNVMIIGGLSTIIFNGNPLLRFDGYYVLSDAVEIPSLSNRANRYYGYLIQKYIFKVQGVESPVLAQGEARWFSVYAVAAFIYRIFLIITISLLVASQYFFIGVALAIWALFMQLVMPVVKWISFLLFSPTLVHQRDRSIAITTGALVLVLALVFFIPAPLNTMTEGVVWVPEKSHIRAKSDGFVESVLVMHGESVTKGEPLIKTNDPLVHAKLKLLNAEQRELEIRHLSLVKKDIVQAELIQEELGLIKGKIKRLQEQISELVIDSPDNGVFTLANTGDMTGHYLRQGDPVAYVVNYDEVSVRVVVPQNAIGLVRQNVTGVEIRLVDKINQPYATTISREIPSATYRLPSKALSQHGGGIIKTDPFDTNGVKTKDQYFQFEVLLPGHLKKLHIGQRVYIKLLHGYEPLAFQWYRKLEELLLNELVKL